MSSQGPAAGSNTEPSGITGCYGPLSPSQVPEGYPFSTRSFRDSSDWTTYKKQAVLSNDINRYNTIDKGFSSSNTFRLEVLNGESKCDVCQANTTTTTTAAPAPTTTSTTAEL